MPESYSAREALAILRSAEYCYTYADNGKNLICKAELSQKERGKEIGKKKAGQFSLMFCLYIIGYIRDQSYYTDMNWRYNTLLLSNCKGSQLSRSCNNACCSVLPQLASLVGK